MFKFSPVEESNEFLGVIVDDELYSINIENVQEIITVPPITRIPNSPRFVEGAINLRGKVLKIINLRKRLGLPFKHFDANTRIVVLNAEATSYGVIVDQVLEVFKIGKADKVELPKLLRNEEQIKYARNIIKKTEDLFINFDFTKINVI